MDIVMGFLSKIDVTAVIASGVTFLLGWGIVKIHLSKAVAVLGDVADLISAVKKSVEDGKLDKSEIEAILTEAQELIAEVKK